MTDKESIRKKLEHIVQRRLNLLNGEEFDLWLETKGFTNEIVDTIIDSLQEDLSFHCGDCIKWKDGKGCTLEAENTHCITDTACSKGVEKSKQEDSVDVGTQIDYQNDAIKNLNNALNSMEHNSHLPKMMTAAESLGISQEEHDRIVDELIYGKEPELVDVDDLPNKEEEPVSEPNEQLAEIYLAVFDKKFPILPTLKGKQLADYKNFLNKCQQIFGLKEWGIRPTQAKLFEKLSLLWAAWGVEHLQGIGRQDKKEQDIPVSEDLEEVALEYANNQLIKSGVTDTNCPRELAVAQASLMVNGFKAGAKWQKEKDYKDGLDNDDFLTFAYMDGMEEGKKEMREQMIKNSIEVKVKSDKDGLFTTETWDEMNELLQKIGAKEGDKVYISIIKQEEE